MFSSSVLPSTLDPAEPTLTQLPDGRLAASWSARRTGEAGQRSIWFSVFDKTGWRPPQVIANRESTAAGTFTHAGELDTPLLYAEGGWLHLWYTSHDSLAGSSLNHSMSTSSGSRWSKPERLEISPLAVGSLHLDTMPVARDDGGLSLALARTFLNGHSSWLHLSATGRILGLQRLPIPGQQAAAVVLDPQHGLALLHNQASGRVYLASTKNGGQSWQAGGALSIANHTKQIALLRLASGRLLLAGNPLWLSTDAGQTWQRSRIVEKAGDSAADFSEPTLLLGKNGQIHLAYISQRAIKQVSFNEAWLDGAQP